jgi:CBS domain-containing protein
MPVCHILREKGREIVAIPAEATLFKASNISTENSIGALLVLDRNGAIEGDISERDIIRTIAEGGPAALTLTVAERMTKDIAICDETTTIEEIMQIMTRCRFRHVPVVENGRVSGIVSIGDVVKMRIAETICEAQALKEYIATGYHARQAILSTFGGMKGPLRMR